MTTDITELAQSLKAAAEKAGIEQWVNNRGEVVSAVVEQLVLTFPEPCPRCGVTSTRPNGEHYCHANSVEAE